MLRTFSAYWRSHIFPSPAALAMVAVAGALIGLGFACSTLYGISAGTSFADGMERFTFTFGFMALPVAAVLFLIAAARDSRSLPRGLMIGTAAFIVLLGGLLTSYGIGSGEGSSFVISAATFLFFFVPVAIVLFGMALYFVSKGLPVIRAEIAAERERRAIQMIEARGEVTLADLASELGLRVDACDNIVDSALKAERFFGLHDAPRGRVYSAAALRERQSRLAAIVTARGQIRLDDLAHELSAPRELTRTWLYELVKRSEFTGYINWDEGVLYSAEARRLTEKGRCPYCNGELSLAGKGVIRCKYCSSEIFL
jgi:hypothetical protein